MLRRVTPPSASLLPAALAAATLLGAAPHALAQTPPPDSQPAASAQAAPPPPVEAAAPRPLEAPLPLFGLMLDVGLPDGIGASGVVRPLDWLRFNGGVLTNTVGFGLRAGVSVAPFRFVVTPSLNADVGRYFKADYTKLVERFGGDPGSAEATLKDVGYTFASASLGLEVGSQRGFSFFLRAGLSYWDFSPADAEPALRDAAGDPTLEVSPVSLRFSSPSVKLGFTLFL
jgi:hypothetical protein